MVTALSWEDPRVRLILMLTLTLGLDVDFPFPFGSRQVFEGMALRDEPRALGPGLVSRLPFGPLGSSGLTILSARPRHAKGRFRTNSFGEETGHANVERFPNVEEDISDPAATPCRRRPR